MGEYYFITYVIRRLGRQFFESEVIDEHPFNWLKRSQLETNLKMVLAGWQEISEEDYEMFLDEEISEKQGIISVPRSNPLELMNRDPSEGLES
jgi:hypothetical protein